MRYISALAVLIVIAALFTSGDLSSTVSEQQQGIHAVVDENGFLVGGTINGEWKSARQMKTRIRGGERYRTYVGPRSAGWVVGTKPDRNLQVRFRPDALGKIALAADWNAVPRKPKKDTTHLADDKAAIRSILDEKGLRRSPVVIKETLQVDIEGDGRPEWLTSAASMDPSSYTVGDYSIVVLRRMKKGKSQAYLVAGDLHVKESVTEVSRYYTLTGAYDLDGDNTLEIVVSVIAYGLESYWTEIHKVVSGKLRLVAAVRPNYDYKLSHSD